MSRVDELLEWLASRRPTCSTCGSALWAIAGPDGIGASSCPNCDVTPGAVLASLADRSPSEDHDEHWTPIAGCSDCADESFQRRARIRPRSAGADYRRPAL